MHRIVKAIKQAATEAVEASNPVRILFGDVVGIAPLRVMIDQKLMISEPQIILTKNVIDYQTQISFDNPDIKQVYTTWDMGETNESNPNKIAFKQIEKHDITVYNHLNIGDRVILIQSQGGQTFTILDKVVK